MKQESTSAIGFFERYLSVWVGLCIVAGVGRYFQASFKQ